MFASDGTEQLRSGGPTVSLLHPTPLSDRQQPHRRQTSSVLEAANDGLAPCRDRFKCPRSDLLASLTSSFSQTRKDESPAGIEMTPSQSNQPPSQWHRPLYALSPLARLPISPTVPEISPEPTPQSQQPAAPGHYVSTEAARDTPCGIFRLHQPPLQLHPAQLHPNRAILQTGSPSVTENNPATNHPEHYRNYSRTPPRRPHAEGELPLHRHPPVPFVAFLSPTAPLLCIQRPLLRQPLEEVRRPAQLANTHGTSTYQAI